MGRLNIGFCADDLVNLGVGGIWNDMNEPSVFNENKTIAPSIIHENNGAPKTHEEWHNLYGMLMCRAAFYGLRNARPEERPFILTRSAYAGIQRYAAVWTGDNRSFWEHLALAMPMILNMGLSGLALAGADVGGFAHHASGELLVRWMQMGALLPFFRNHSSIGTVRQESWSFGKQVETICKRYIELRYRLMPYLYASFAETTKTGLPVVRPLVLEYPDDAHTYNLCDEFLVGRDLLVAPVYRPGADHRAVYLPKGVWLDYWTNERFEGERYILANAPLDTLPVFVRAGAVITESVPLSSTMEWTPETPLIFNAYIDSNCEGKYLWYEDDGETYAYESGQYNEVEFDVTSSGKSVSIAYKPMHRGFGFQSRPVTLRIHKKNEAPEDLQIDDILISDQVTINL